MAFLFRSGTLREQCISSSKPFFNRLQSRKVEKFHGSDQRRWCFYNVFKWSSSACIGVALV